jgi:hypothetical protein
MACRNIVYRTLDPDLAHDIMHWADQLNIDYDIWNAAASILGRDTKIELGLPHYAWNLWDSHIGLLIHKIADV